MLVSIHAPVKGATGKYRQQSKVAYSFNPRAREGRDLHEGGLYCYKTVVSIHAPVKGATIDERRNVYSAQGFNPRAREGRDGKIETDLAGINGFQSTRP